MKRAVVVVEGLLAIALGVGLVALFGVGWLSQPLLAGTALVYATGAVLAVAGGTTDSVGPFGWQTVVGTGTVAFGLTGVLQLPIAVVLGHAGDLPLAGAIALTGLGIVAVGADGIRDGGVVDYSRLDRSR